MPESLRESGLSLSHLLPDLKRKNNWICWANHRDNTKDKKIPLNTNKYKQRVDEFVALGFPDKSIRMGYQEAWNRFQEHDAIDGIGFVIKDSPFCYFDIDNCVDPDTLEVDTEARKIVDQAKSYTELSTSKTGLHIICRGSTPKYGWSHPEKSLEVGIFDGSWVTITQDHIDRTPTTAERADDLIDEVCHRYRIDTHGGW